MSEEKVDKLKDIANALCELLGEKAKNYGNAFEKTDEILRILAPDGIKPHQYRHILYVARLLDKLFRIMKDSPDDEEPIKDIAGYSLLELLKNKDG